MSFSSNVIQEEPSEILQQDQTFFSDPNQH